MRSHHPSSSFSTVFGGKGVRCLLVAAFVVLCVFVGGLYPVHELNRRNPFYYHDNMAGKSYPPVATEATLAPVKRRAWDPMPTHSMGGKLIDDHRDGGGDAAAGSSPRASHSDDPALLTFTIVVLVYKSPKSLTAVLQSLHTSGIIFHPQLQEIIVYFQAFENMPDINTVTAAISEWPIGPYRQMIRVVGRRENLPVAKATFAALQEVKTKLVLYLECDRPALVYEPFPAQLQMQREQERKLRDHKNELELAMKQQHRLEKDGRRWGRSRDSREAAMKVGIDVAAAAAVTVAAVNDGAETTGPQTASPAELLESLGVSKADQARARFAALAIIDTAIRTLAQRRADVFRLQVYANKELESATPQLQPKHYGTGPFYEKCGSAPYFSKSFCGNAKNSDRSLFNAYCKHWAKVQTQVTQQDMCDATCFVRWHDMISAAAPLQRRGSDIEDAELTPAERLARQKEVGVNDTFIRELTDVAKSKMIKNVRSLKDGREESGSVLCTDSSLCNWSNQPSMYYLDWYRKNVREPCLENPKGCVGKPGRKSAVLQEVFFVKSKKDWADRKHRICVHRRGLFVHQELDE